MTEKPPESKIVEGAVEARVPSAKITVAGMSVTGQVRRLHDQLVLDAEDLLSQGRRREAVVIAMTAAEVGMTRALRSLLDAQAPKLTDAVLESIERLSPVRERSQAIWKALTGDSINKPRWWQQYKAAVALRNHVVHRGEDPTEQEATSAVQSARPMLDHLRSVLDATGVKHDLHSDY